MPGGPRHDFCTGHTYMQSHRPAPVPVCPLCAPAVQVARALLEDKRLVGRAPTPPGVSMAQQQGPVSLDALLKLLSFREHALTYAVGGRSIGQGTAGLACTLRNWVVPWVTSALIRPSEMRF